MTRPAISVVMAVYNGARFLRQAIDSILVQTRTDFEFIVIDDGSSDETSAILDTYRDDRLVRLRNAENCGLAASLNRGFRVASGRYIARQDADDVSGADRLAVESAHLDAHPQLVLVACAATIIDANGHTIGELSCPNVAEPILQRMWRGNFIVHGGVMMRAEPVVAVGGYDEGFAAAQDYDLWLRLSEQHALDCLARPLYAWRQHGSGVGHRHYAMQQYYAAQAVAASMTRVLQGCLSDVESTLVASRFAHAGLVAVGRGEHDLARRCLSRMMGFSAEFWQTEEFVAMIGHQAVAQSAYPLHIYARLVLECLPVASTVLYRRMVAARVYLTGAFAAHQRRQRQAVLRCAAAAVYNRPQHWSHRGLRSITFQALVGAHARAY